MRTTQPASSGSTPGAVRVIGPWTIYARRWQSLAVMADGGTLTLDYDGDVTAPIAWNADAATVEGALLLAAPALTGHVTVAGGPLADQVMTFLFDETIINPPMMIADAALLGFSEGPGTAAVYISEVELGIETYTPAVGDLILDCFIERVEGVNGFVYLADAIDGGGDFTTSEVPMTDGVTDDEAGTKFSGNNGNEYRSLAVYTATTDAGEKGKFPTRSLDGSPIYAVLSDAGGTDAFVGIVKVWLQVATPVAP